MSETFLDEVLVDARWQRAEQTFISALAAFGVPHCHGPLHEAGRERFVGSIGPWVASELLTTIASVDQAEHVVHVDHVLDGSDIDGDPAQAVLALAYRCQGGLPGRHGLTARPWGLEARHLDPVVFRRRHRVLADVTRRLMRAAWPLTGGSGEVPRLRLHPGLGAGMTASYLLEAHALDLWLDDYVARDLLGEEEGPDLVVTVLHELAHAATPWRVRVFEPEGRDRLVVPYVATVAALEDHDGQIDHVLGYGLSEHFGMGETVPGLRTGSIQQYTLTALNESLTDLWAQELLVELRASSRSSFLTGARSNDRSAYRPGRSLVRDLIGDVSAATIARSDDPMATLLTVARMRHGDTAVDALMRAIHVPPTEDELDGHPPEVLAALFARLTAAVGGRPI